MMHDLARTIVEILNDHTHVNVIDTSFDHEFGVEYQYDLEVETDDAFVDALKSVPVELDPNDITLDGDGILVDFGLPGVAELRPGDTFQIRWTKAVSADDDYDPDYRPARRAPHIPSSVEMTYVDTFRFDRITAVWNVATFRFEASVEMTYIDSQEV